MSEGERVKTRSPFCLLHNSSQPMARHLARSRLHIGNADPAILARCEVPYLKAQIAQKTIDGEWS
jgi:hypothetical protein